MSPAARERGLNVGRAVAHNGRTMPTVRFVRQPAPHATWLARPLARSLLAAEQRDLIPVVTTVYGQLGVYVRPVAAPAELSGNMLRSVLRLHLHRDAPPDGELRGDVRMSASAWALEEDSVDLVYLAHALEIAPDPRALLREAARVLAPQGTLVVLSLNPLSPWALRWLGRGPRPLAAAAVRRWVTDAGLEVTRQQHVGPCWPVRPRRHRRGDGPDLLAPLRSGVALLARKRRLEGIKARRTPRPVLARGAPAG